MSNYKDYYENYFGVRTADTAYYMEKMAGSSRVRFIKNYLQKFAPQGSRVLDIGCGDFYLSRLMPEYTWTGIDINTELKLNTIKHDLSVKPYPLESGIFDAINCSEVIEHVWEPRAIYSEANRLLKMGGHFILSSPNHDNIDWILDGHKEMLYDDKFSHQTEHIRFYNYETHKRYLERFGFEVVTFNGCDAQFVKFFDTARHVLFSYFRDYLKIPHDPGQVDQIIGQMFPKHDAGIMLVAKKVKEHAD